MIVNGDSNFLDEKFENLIPRLNPCSHWGAIKADEQPKENNALVFIDDYGRLVIRVEQDWSMYIEDAVIDIDCEPWHGIG